jgi:hypothetical protein
MSIVSCHALIFIKGIIYNTLSQKSILRLFVLKVRVEVLIPPKLIMP